MLGSFLNHYVPFLSIQQQEVGISSSHQMCSLMLRNLLRYH